MAVILHGIFMFSLYEAKLHVLLVGFGFFHNFYTLFIVSFLYTYAMCLPMPPPILFQLEDTCIKG